ncbi:MAG: hypothetical protein HDR05_15945 [Lachnospiraceae bacterium]|nr:hypothetical protein [Lachnospiraceae bacterium]
MSHEWVDATCTEPRTCTVGGETEGEALGHTWVEATCEEAKHCSKCGETEGVALGHTLTEATYKEAAVCTICGKTEGEPKQSYFEEHGAEVADAPVACTLNTLLYNYDNPEEYQMVIDGTREQIECYSEPAEEDGYQLIHLKLCMSMQAYYDAAQDIVYDTVHSRSSIYDWYTGRMLPTRTIFDDDVFDSSVTLDIDGISFDLSYTLETQWEWDDWVYDDDGNAHCDGRCYTTYIFKVSEGYDGLVFEATPMNEYNGVLDTETVRGTGTTEDDIFYAFDESNYIEGRKFFRINKEGTVPERLADKGTDTAE